MTQDEKQIAIAEACGLFKIAPLKRTNRKGKDDPFGVRLWYCDSNHGGVKEYAKIPNYPEDLNAMHEAEKVLFPTHEADWHLNLARVCGHSWRIMLTSTAAQRAEAFGLTLNLWK